MKKKLIIGMGLLAVLGITAMVAYTAWRIHLLEGMNPEGLYFNSNGVPIHYTLAGTGVPVILVHGLGINAGINFGVHGTKTALAEEYQVITLDLRGHGRSGKPHDPEQYGEEMCEDIIRLMDHLRINKAHVLGYSMGGFIVLKLATLHPERLLSFAPCAAGWTPESEKEFGFFEELADDLDQGKGYGLLSDRLTPIGQKVRWHERYLMDRGLSLLNDEVAMSALLRSVPKLIVPEEALRKNTIPALAVVGASDPLRVFTEKMAEVTTNMQLIIMPEGDHMTTLHKAATLEAIKAFLKENSKTKETTTLPDAA